MEGLGTWTSHDANEASSLAFPVTHDTITLGNRIGWAATIHSRGPFKKCNSVYTYSALLTNWSGSYVIIVRSSYAGGRPLQINS